MVMFGWRKACFVGIVMSVCVARAGVAFSQAPFIIEGKKDAPQLGEAPLPAYDFALRDQVEVFNPALELIDLLESPDLLADVPATGLSVMPDETPSFLLPRPAK